MIVSTKRPARQTVPRFIRSRPRSLVDPARITLEVAVSRTTGRLLLLVESSGVEQFWAEGIGELVIDLGREDLLVIGQDGRATRRRRDG